MLCLRIGGRLLAAVLILIGTAAAQDATALPDLGEHGFAQSGEVKIHYVTRGKGPLLVMIDGFPDYWYTWRNQIPELANQFRIDNELTLVTIPGAGHFCAA